MRNIYLLYAGLVLIGFGLFLYLGSIDTLIIYDEVYSENLINYSFLEILQVTAHDVHPPLYYWGLKAYSNLLCDSILVLRSFSALGMLSVFLLGCFPIRRLFGHRVALFFILLIIIFPVSQYLGVDIRMYSWTMFFVLACALFALDVYRRGKNIDWLKFFITSVCAAYLHNYGLLSVFWIYALLFIFLLNSKKNWKSLIICGILFSVIYLPWFFQLFAQVRNVNTSYWIQPLTLNDLFLHIYYFYSPKEIWFPFVYFTKIQMMLALITLMVIQLYLSIKVLVAGIKNKDKDIFIALVSFTAFLLPIIAGFIYSLVVTPVMVTRYMTCTFGLFALSIAIILSKGYDSLRLRPVIYLFLALLSLDGAVRFYTNKKYYEASEDKYNQINSFIGGTQEIIVNDYSSYVLPLVQKIVPEHSYYILSNQATPQLDNKPFNFRVLEQLPTDSTFILLHEPREEVQAQFKEFRKSLSSDYTIIDSLVVPEMTFYHIKQKRKPL